MKAIILILLTFAGCSREESLDNSEIEKHDYVYNSSELEAIDLINEYRLINNLPALNKSNHASFKSYEHNCYMISKNVTSHDGFSERSNNITRALKAITVGENVASGYKTPKGAMDSWLKSDRHRKNIEGDFTHIGISIKEDSLTGKKYYTNIFIKI